MPSQNNNIIKNLRGKHDPHYKLAARVEGLEKEIPLHFNELHKTLSKSFGLQRKTLVRVVALEKKVSESRGPKKQTQEQPLGDWGEEPVEWDRSGKSSSPEGEDGSPDRESKIKGASKLMGGSSALGKESNVGKLANITKRVTIRVGKVERLSALNAEKITKLKDITKLRKENVDKKIGGGESSSRLLESLNGINENVDGMLSILGERMRFQRKSASDERKRREKETRGRSEKSLETSFKGIGKIAQKVLSPAMSLWERLWEFISTVFLGRIAMKIFDWFTDKKNQKKIAAIGRFFKDWWPLILSSYLIFGTGFIKMAAGLVKAVGWGIGKIIVLIPKLMAALAKLKVGKLLKMIPGGKILGGLGLTALIAGGVGFMGRKGEENLGEVTGDEGFTANTFGSGSAVPVNPSPDKNSPSGGRNPFEQMFNQGGQVPGRGPNKDTVPAMLTPGEFVMSRDAVDKWGADTLANMNAAGGGTNIPTIRGGYNTGGKAFDRSHYGTPGYQIGQINPDTLVVDWEEFREKSREHIGKGGPGGPDYDRFIEDIDYDMPGRTREKIEYKEGSLVGEETYESDIAAIGVPDLREHKDQLLSAIHAVEGYEKVTIDDVIHSRVNMPLKQYLPILMSSDAQKATFAKKDAAHQADLKLRGITDPSKGYSMGYDFNLGGLVQGFAGGGLAIDKIYNRATGRIEGKNAPKGLSRGLSGIADWATFGIWDFDQRGNLFGGQHSNSGFGGVSKEQGIAHEMQSAFQQQMMDAGAMNKKGGMSMDYLLGKSPKTSVPGPPNKPKTTVAYDQQMQQAAGAGIPGSDMELPSIDPGAFISAPKIAVLGISV